MIDKNYAERIYCSKENKERLMKTCMGIYLKYHSDMKDLTLTPNFILGKIIDKYIEDDK